MSQQELLAKVVQALNEADIDYMVTGSVVSSLQGEPFDISRFGRKCVEEVMGMKLNVSCPEDTILAKLRWAMLSGGSEKQYIDALHVYEVQFGKLDMDYLEEWARRLEVGSYLQRLIDEAEPL